MWNLSAAAERPVRRFLAFLGLVALAAGLACNTVPGDNPGGSYRWSAPIPAPFDDPERLASFGGTPYASVYYNADAPRLARLNNGVWAPFGGPTNDVSALFEFNGQLFAGGIFRSLGGDVPAHGIASTTGAGWTTYQPGISGQGDFPSVVAFGSYNGELIVGGYFNSAGGLTAGAIAALAGRTWRSLDGGIGDSQGVVRALRAWSGKLYVGGRFNVVGTANLAVNNVASWNGTAWEALAGGITSGAAGSSVNQFLDYDGQLLVCGSFASANGSTANGIARWNGATWSAFPGGGVRKTNGDPGVIRSAVPFNGELIVGGEFARAGETDANNIAAWNGSAWRPLAEGIQHTQSGATVIDMLVHGDALIVIGSFNRAGQSPADDYAVWSRN